MKLKKVIQKKRFASGDLITTDFEGEYMLTYSQASLEITIPNDVRFDRGEVGIILSTVQTPDSYYNEGGFAMILVKQGCGWVPYRWLRRA